MRMLSGDSLVQSPLNYTGGKFRLLPQILPHFPKKIKTFVDLFCGGGNVGANVRCENVVFNDILLPLMAILRMFKNMPCDRIVAAMEKLIAKYSLSSSFEMGYAHYGCKSNDGLGKYNARQFMELRNDFNARYARKGKYTQKSSIMLFCLIVHAFNNQIRFNAANEFNLPVGKRDFNNSCRKKLADFTERLQAIQCSFECRDFANFEIDTLDVRDFVYIDPPYLLSRATYNEQGKWNGERERELLRFMDALDVRGIRFALSNVLESGGRTNSILGAWLRAKRYRKIELRHSYYNSSYHKTDKASRDMEMLVVNYH